MQNHAIEIDGVKVQIKSSEPAQCPSALLRVAAPSNFSFKRYATPVSRLRARSPQTVATMNPSKVDRSRVVTLTDLPNIGAASAQDLRLLGIHHPSQLVGKCPFEMYEVLCAKTSTRHDPCVIDVFMSVTRFMGGDEPRPWWAYTQDRKQLLKQQGSNK